MKLDQYLMSKLYTPFEWGVHDCVMFASEWVSSRTGRHVLSDLPQWDNKVAALRVIASVGGLESGVSARLGPKLRTSPKDGDLALLPSTLGGMCIVSGPYVIGVSIPSGFQFYPQSAASAFWSLN
jgi:hypothetical protein